MNVTKSVRSIAGAALAAMLMVGALAATPAQAFTVDNVGCPGWAQVPRTTGINFTGLYVEFPARSVFRSDCYSSSAQKVTIRYRLWRLDPSRGWVYYTEKSYANTLQPGYRMDVPTWQLGSNYKSVSGDILIEWRTIGGALIGSQYVNLNAVGDYSCSGCFVRTDPTVGAYLTLGW